MPHSDEHSRHIFLPLLLVLNLSLAFCNAQSICFYVWLGTRTFIVLYFLYCIVYPFIVEMLPEIPMYLAHDTIQREMKPRVRPVATIFSWIFSQTRGTPKKAVGCTSFNVSPREPCIIRHSIHHYNHLHCNGHITRWTWVGKFLLVIFFHLFSKRDFEDKWHRFHQSQMPLLTPNQQCESTENNQKGLIIY